LTSIKKFKSVSALRSKFNSRKSVFDEAKDEILNDLDKKATTDKSLIGLEEKADESIEISESEQSEHIFSGLFNGLQLFHFGQHHNKDKKLKQMSAKPSGNQGQN